MRASLFGAVDAETRLQAFEGQIVHTVPAPELISRVVNDRLGRAQDAEITQQEIANFVIQKGIDEGARLVAGGTGRPDGLNRGYYVRPTVFADVNNDMTVAREEIFGPVLSILPFDTEEEAIAIANDTPYGLTNYVQTQDDAKRARVARRMRAGMVETNGVDRAQGAPFGGYKQSGNGREGGVWGIEEFLEVKSVSGLAAD